MVSILSLNVQGKPVFSLEGKNITCLAGDEKNNEIAVGDSDGHVTIYGTADWSVKCALTVPVEEKTTVLSLQYGRVNLGQRLPRSILMVSRFRVLLCNLTCLAE